MTRRGSFQVWLKPANVLPDRQTVSGKLYVTLPRKTVKDLRPKQSVTVSGQLYRPQATARPHGFDFTAFLARDGAFAGLKAHKFASTILGWIGVGRSGSDRTIVTKGNGCKNGCIAGSACIGQRCSRRSLRS
ncbi:MAG: DUF4131 domain-containing protein [Acaryochloridaceae cyanobacterium RU_4_10]|nr:DUF4131 domain-containing protein [Acaryochloridaceae cyanobacterium RU_4_10]